MLYRKLVEEHLENGGSKLALSDGIQTYTLQQLHQSVLRRLSVFQERGLSAGSRILILDRDPMETAITLLSCIAGGYICIPLNSRLDEKSQNEMIQSCHPALVIDGNFRDDCSRASPLGETRPLYGEETPVYLLYTSGSTGAPKGILARQKQIFFCCNAIRSRLELNSEDRILCTLPLSFDYGMYQIFLALFSKATLFLDASGVLQRIPYLLKSWTITVFPTIPTVVNLLTRLDVLNKDTASNLRSITLTGEILPIPVTQRLRQCLPEVQIVPMYGLTECKRVSVMPLGREDKILAGSCGLPLDGISVWLEHQDPETGVGELVVAGDNVMEGDWERSAGDTAPFFMDPVTGIRSLRTGDLFRIDEDGFLYFCGRKNNCLKIRGFRVSGAWLEEQFLACPEVLEAAAVRILDSSAGESAAVFLVMAEGTSQERAWEQYRRLPSYLWDVKLLFWNNPLPKNRNGKLNREALRHIAEEVLHGFE